MFKFHEMPWFIFPNLQMTAYDGQTNWETDQQSDKSKDRHLEAIWEKLETGLH